MPRSLIWLVFMASLLIAGVALFLRVDGLGEPSLWYDEILHLQNAQAALEEPGISWLTGLEVDHENGPLYYATQLLAMRLAAGEVAVRLMPALAGWFTVAIIAGLGFAAGKDRLTAMVAASLLALSPLHVCLSREGRPYAAVILMASLLLLLLLLRDRRWTVPGAYITSLLTAYTGAVAAPALIAFAILSAVDWRHSPRTRTAWPGHFLTAALLGLGATFVIFPAAERLATSRIPPIYMSTHPLSVTALDRLLASLTVSGVDSASSQPMSFLLLALAGSGVLFQARRAPRQALHIAGMLVLPVIGWIAVLTILDRWYLVRYTAVGLPAFILLVAIGLVSLTREGWSWVSGRNSALSWVSSLASLGLVLLLSIWNWTAVRTEPWQKADWRGLATLIGQLSSENEPVLAHSDWAAITIRHYLERVGVSIEVFNSWNDLARAQQWLEDRDRAWVLTAGYERASDFRAWMRTLDPVVLGDFENLALYFFPDFSTFLSSPGRAVGLHQALAASGSRTDLQDFSDSELLLGTGWSFPEISGDGTDFRWAAAHRAEIGLLPNAAVDSVLRLRLLPFPLADAPPQSLEVQVNDLAVAELELEPGWHDYDIPITKQTWRPGTNLLTFRFGWLRSPADLDPNAVDKRQLATAFDSATLLEVSAAP